MYFATNLITEKRLEFSLLSIASNNKVMRCACESYILFIIYSSESSTLLNKRLSLFIFPVRNIQ